MSKDPAAELPLAQALCADIISSIASTSIDRFAFQAPVIDRQTNLPYENPLPTTQSATNLPNAEAGPSCLDSSKPGGTHDAKRRGVEALWKNGQHRGSSSAQTGDRQGLNTWCQTEILGWNRFISGLEKQKAHLDEIAKRPDMIRESPLPSVQSSATLWKQILIAHTPITGVRAVMRSTGDKIPRKPPPPARGRFEALCLREASPAGSTRTATSDGRDSMSDEEVGQGQNGSDKPKVGKRQARRSQRAADRLGQCREFTNGQDPVANGTRPPDKAEAPRTGKKADEVVIDVVARGGAEWIKIYTKKEAQLLAEFREHDSYLCSDWSESDADDDLVDGRSGGERQEKGLTNTIIELARSILAVAHATPRPPGTVAPRLTMRFTRLTPVPVSDEPRIGETFRILRGMGVNLTFGDLSDVDFEELTPGYTGERAVTANGLTNGNDSEPALLPSLRINLDPTALVGLCCDLLHHPLHADIEQARKRYFRPRRYLHEETSSTGWNVSPEEPDGKEANGQTDTGSLQVDSESGEYLNGYDDLAQSQHSRELFKEALEEASAPLIEEMRDLLGAAVQARRRSGEADPRIEWYATPTALRHLREAMGNTAVVGEGREQMRMRRLIGLEEGDFFEGSRYEGEEGVLRGIRVQVMPDGDATDELERPVPGTNGYTIREGDDGPGNGDEVRATVHGTTSQNGANGTQASTKAIRSFHQSLASATSLFLSEYHAVPAEPSLLRSGGAHANLPPFLRPDRLPVPKVASLTLPLPIVSLMSMQRGAAEGMTTLSMGNVVFRELWREGRWKCRGWTQGGWELERERELAARREKIGVEVDDEEWRSGIGQRPGQGHAVVWLMPYRSLGEGKRVRFENGDYAFPASLEQGDD